MNEFSFGFWAWFGKTFAELAIVGAIIALVFAGCFVYAAYLTYIKGPRVRRKMVQSQDR